MCGLFPGRFLADCDSRVVLAFLSFVFNLFCNVFKEKSDKGFIGGHKVEADAMRNSRYNMENKILQ